MVELEVVSNIDTVVSDPPRLRRPADRAGLQRHLDRTATRAEPAAAGGTGGVGGSAPCRACRCRRPASRVDAGADAPPSASDSRDGHVRAALDPGTYFVLVDEAEPFGVGGDFVLKVSSATPPAQSSCTTALPLADGTNLAAEQLDLASGNAISCSGGTPAPGAVLQGDHPLGPAADRPGRRPPGAIAPGPRCCSCWTAAPRPPLCLATDTRPAQRRQPSVLRYVNNGPSRSDGVAGGGGQRPGQRRPVPADGQHRRAAPEPDLRLRPAR